MTSPSFCNSLAPPFRAVSGVPSHILQMPQRGMCRPQLGQTIPALAAAMASGLLGDFPFVWATLFWLTVERPSCLARDCWQCLHLILTCGAGASSRLCPSLVLAICPC